MSLFIFRQLAVEKFLIEYDMNWFNLNICWEYGVPVLDQLFFLHDVYLKIKNKVYKIIRKFSANKFELLNILKRIVKNTI